MDLWYVYIMTNKTNSVLYIGITDNIEECAKEHKLKKYPDSFTAKYNCNELIYFEEHSFAETAIKREKQLKKWKREWKINLITNMNPSWSDLTMNWNLNYNKLR
jgi:putative endonuclease